MGKQKKTRKFAAVKRMINPKDPRITCAPPARSPRAPLSLPLPPPLSAAGAGLWRRQGQVDKKAKKKEDVRHV